MTSTAATNRNRRRPTPPGRQRRAVVAVVVLLLIAVALATSYSAMRTQTITLNVRQNAMLSVSARRAALTGLTAGLREMHSPDWSGTDSTFTQTLGANEGFHVQFIAGDSGLTVTDADYSDLPYRVTLEVTGTASDPSDARRVSQHTIHAVARLIPRALPSEPSDWSQMDGYTFYQTEEHATTLDIPCRIEGNVRLQGKLYLGRHYPDDWDAWVYYFYHLNQMRSNGFNDYRTLTGRVYYNYWAQDGYIRDILTYMDVSTSHREVSSASADWIKPTCLTSYRLFPGGPEYEVATIASSTLENVTLTDSVTDNPLGLYYVNSTVTIGDNVTVRGTLFCRETIRIDGTNVRFESIDAVPLHGSSLPIRLPVITCRDFDVRSGASCTVDGLLAAFGDVDVERAAARGSLTVSGKLIAEDLDILEDTDWDNLDWHGEFDDYLAVGGPSWTYFPVWMVFRGYHCVPTVHIKQGEDVQYHWYRPGESLFIPHPDDFSEMDSTKTPGLRWELIQIVHENE